ncbi:hypothetical protein C5S42_00110, partial [Candidatus Methanomarinus sp.]
MRYLIGAALLCVFIPFSESSDLIQTDWSGGPGVPGVVFDWGDEFDSSTEINWIGESGNILLHYGNPVPHLIDTAVDSSDFAVCVDLNMDNFLDVVTAVDDAILWYENDGTGTSWVADTIASDLSGRIHIRAANIDGDGEQDIVAIYGNSIVWYRNDLTLWSIQGIASMNSPSDVWVIDIDNDADMDVVATSEIGTLCWYENRLPGQGWVTHLISNSLSNPQSCQCADFEPDGDPDIVIADYGANKILWFENLGNGATWSEHTTISPTNPTCASFGNIDGVGNLEIVSCSASGVYYWKYPSTLYALDPSFTDGKWLGVSDSIIGGTSVIFCIGETESAWWAPDYTGAKKFNIAGCDDGTCIVSGDINDDNTDDLLCTSWGDGIIWYDIVKYVSDAELISSVLDTQDFPFWETITWSGIQPSGTSIGFQVRSSTNPMNMGAWSDTITVPGSVSEYLTDGDNFIQYKALLTSSTSLETPELEDITITYSNTALGES